FMSANLSPSTQCEAKSAINSEACVAVFRIKPDQLLGVRGLATRQVCLLMYSSGRFTDSAFDWEESRSRFETPWPVKVPCPNFLERASSSSPRDAGVGRG